MFTGVDVDAAGLDDAAVFGDSAEDIEAARSYSPEIVRGIQSLQDRSRH